VDVSLLIPTKGRTHQLQALVDHLREMIPQEIAYEILIRDASPSNGTILQGASFTYAKELSSRAFNLMAEEATGEFLFILGDDMRIYPRTIPLALTLMRGLPKGTVGITFHADPLLPCHTYFMMPELWIMARETFHWLGGFDEQFSYGYADCDLGMKAYHARLPLISLLGVCVEHRHVDDETKTYNMKTFFAEDEKKFFAKWPLLPLTGVVQGHPVDFRAPKFCPYPHERHD